MSLQPREDLAEGHAHAWARIARPGTWWTGPERVAIAQAVRDAWDCPLNAARKQSLSPNLPGEHLMSPGVAETLNAATIDAVHRITTDQARLSREWVDDLVDSGAMTQAQYVELLGVVTQVVSMDTLRLALDLELDPLPAPEAGDPTRYAPANLSDETGWLAMIPEDRLAEPEKDLWGQFTGNVIRALSSVPDEVRALKKLSSHHYIAVDQMRDFVGGEGVGRSISRAQMELVAGRISALHECFY